MSAETQFHSSNQDSKHPRTPKPTNKAVQSHAGRDCDMQSMKEVSKTSRLFSPFVLLRARYREFEAGIQIARKITMANFEDSSQQFCGIATLDVDVQSIRVTARARLYISMQYDADETRRTSFQRQSRQPPHVPS